MRWTSRENLLTAATDEDPQLFVSLYDFQAGGENQLSLRKTEQVRILSYNKSGEWCEAHNAQGNLYIVLFRARPDWAYEFPDRTGPDTQICRTGPVGPD